MLPTREDVKRKKFLFPITGAFYSPKSRLLRIPFQKVDTEIAEHLIGRYIISTRKGKKSQAILLTSLEGSIGESGELSAQVKGINLDKADTAQIIIFDHGKIRFEKIQIAA